MAISGRGIRGGRVFSFVEIGVGDVGGGHSDSSWESLYFWTSASKASAFAPSQ